MSHRPRKRFGQNFLRDPNTIRRIADVVGVNPGAKIIEIGPGEGALTAELLRRGAKLTAIEIDRDLADQVRDRFAERDFELIETDVLVLDPAFFAGQKVVGNLPYNISTPLLFHLLGSDFEEGIFMLQREVAQRMGATAGNKTYGRLSVMVQAQCKVDLLFDVPPTVFYPQPKVWSSVVGLRPLTVRPSKPALQQLDQLVRAAFAKRRKTLANALRGVVEVEQMEAAGLDTSQRPEEIRVEQWMELAERI